MAIYLLGMAFNLPLCPLDLALNLPVFPLVMARYLRNQCHRAVKCRVVDCNNRAVFNADYRYRAFNT